MKAQLLPNTILIILLSLSSTLFAQKKKASKLSAWDKKRIDAWVITMNQDTFQGQILIADESKLDLWISKDPYTKARKDVEIKSFAPGEIQRILLKRKGRTGQKVLGLAFASGVMFGVSGAMESTRPYGTADNIVASGTWGVISGAIFGSILGIIWGKGYAKNKKMKIEGESETYLKKLSSIRKKALLLTEWGNAYYWERKEN